MQKKKKIILGVDPGTRITGYGIIDASFDPPKVIDFGCIRPPSTLTLEKRYLIIFEALQNLFCHYEPSAVAVESQFVKKNVQSTLKLGMSKGVVFLVAALHSIPISEYSPTKAKLAVVGHGNASKMQVQKMIQMLLHLPHLPTPDDAADALALALCHAHNLQKQERIACSIT